MVVRGSLVPASRLIQHREVQENRAMAAVPERVPRRGLSVRRMARPRVFRWWLKVRACGLATGRAYPWTGKMNRKFEAVKN